MTHASFVALAYGLTVALLALEPVLVWRRPRAARRARAAHGGAEPAA